MGQRTVANRNGCPQFFSYHELAVAAERAGVSTATIRRQVKEQLATNPAFASVNVDVNGKGHVTLSGDVSLETLRAVFPGF